ncbi:putative ribosomal N-acetyltransferase YdaF [Clostridium acetireducens DSM 10703]|uniref:Putative ribosomal N-acetyltransferase YdaF n=1 Tax=Clostridium acetireducens DSM 10703 TaxID=1121290 RepID=A0A1E8EWF7_9CLOT|nr:GNAT family protein [Clostridium acetireducens]OFI04969.1 putative ribosomal N-acetyltransferase YdaF [Clostridium acetireducens DSM 10703]
MVFSNKNSITIDALNKEKNEFIIKDSIGITIGRIFIIEFISMSKYCSMRLKFYKKSNNSRIQLKKVLKKITKYAFEYKKINKVNIIVDENMDTIPFLDLGFYLEGIISNSIILNNVYKDELMFGTDYYNESSSNITRNVVLSSKNLELKVLTPSKAEEVLNYYINNKEHLKYFEPSRDEDFYTLESQKKNLIESYKQFLNGVSVNFGIYKDKKFIGKVQLSNIVMGSFKNAFIGYSIDKFEQGKGYMKEAVKLVLNYAFNEIGLHRIEASTLVDNIKSQKVLLGCGFKKIGLNKRYLFINGKWRDHITFYNTVDK